MVDNRSAGFFGIGGSFNFKSGDISGTAARTQDDKMGQGGEYFAQQKKENDEDSDNGEKYMDRSSILRATLNSLAMMNVANVINAKKQTLNTDEKKQLEEAVSYEQNLAKKGVVNPINHNNKHNPKNKHNEENSKEQLTKMEQEEEFLEEQIEKEYNDFIDFDIDRK